MSTQAQEQRLQGLMGGPPAAQSFRAHLARQSGDDPFAHLRDDAPPVAQCGRCGRKSWSEVDCNRRCLMPQPGRHGEVDYCRGWMRPPA